MPWKKGIATPGAGRPGYEYEAEQLALMKEELSQFLALTKKIREGVATKAEIEAFQIINKPVCKMMDKLHANKIMLSGDRENPVNSIFSVEMDEQTKKMVQEFVEWRKTNNK